MIKRLFDIISSAAALAVTLPFFPLVALAIKLDSKGPVFYCQERVGINGRRFKIVKFRTMISDADRQGPITRGHDRRITRVGSMLRRSKIDEFPTYVNVLMGSMSIVGPRPELPRYVDNYTPQQRRVLSVRPGITDPGTIRFNNEASLMTDEERYEEIYTQQILPEKLRINLEYIDKRNMLSDFRIICATLAPILRKDGRQQPNAE